MSIHTMPTIIKDKFILYFILLVNQMQGSLKHMQCSIVYTKAIL